MDEETKARMAQYMLEGFDEAMRMQIALDLLGAQIGLAEFIKHTQALHVRLRELSEKAAAAGLPTTIAVDMAAAQRKSTVLMFQMSEDWMRFRDSMARNAIGEDIWNAALAEMEKRNG